MRLGLISFWGNMTQDNSNSTPLEATVSPEMERLQRLATEGMVEAASAEASAEDTSTSEEAVGPPYERVPYLNDDITFKDREAELTLMIQLLNFRREAAVRELHYVQRCRDSRYYPGIIHQDPSVGN